MVDLAVLDIIQVFLGSWVILFHIKFVMYKVYDLLNVNSFLIININNDDNVKIKILRILDDPKVREPASL